MSDEISAAEPAEAVGGYTPGEPFTDAAGLTYQPADPPPVELLPGELAEAAV